LLLSLIVLSSLSGKLKHIVRSLVLLGLFSFALIYQSIHQFNTIAQAPANCETADRHFHSDPQNHHCQLCDYQVNHWVSTLTIAKPWPQFIADLLVFLPETVRPYQFHQFTHRGPPLV